MKKNLLLSAFALFGSFAMANENAPSNTEYVKAESIVKVYGCTVSITTITYDGCGNKVDSHTTSYWSDSKSCEGLVMTVKNNYTNSPCIESFPEPER